MIPMCDAMRISEQATAWTSCVSIAGLLSCARQHSAMQAWTGRSRGRDNSGALASTCTLHRINLLTACRWRLLYTSRPGTASPIQRAFTSTESFAIFQEIKLSEQPLSRVTNVVEFGPDARCRKSGYQPEMPHWLSSSARVMVLMHWHASMVVLLGHCSELVPSCALQGDWQRSLSAYVSVKRTADACDFGPVSLPPTV
jgi:PAP_fibrillin